MKILFNDLPSQWREIKDKCSPAIEKLLQSGAYIGGEALEGFEKSFSAYTGKKYAAGISNGTDALKLAVQAFEFYDTTTNVIIPANTYIADALAVAHQPKGNFEITLIDCDEFFQLDLKATEEHLISSRERYDNCIIMPVHLYGHPVNMRIVKSLADKYDCRIIEDASQAHGARSQDEMVGTHGDICAYSLYPGKSLGAMGDAGIVTTNNENYYHKICELRNYGSPQKYHNNDIGWNNRLDPLQAVFLNHKLVHLDKWNLKKGEIAAEYSRGIDSPWITTPTNDTHVSRNVYHIYPILTNRREELQTHLSDQGVPTIIHYPIPIQKSEPFKHLNERPNPLTCEKAEKVLSLPMHPYLRPEEVEHIITAINKFQ
tara:strand:- start:81 stop:1199 length:1119 start_codon:yes stop_codon:yes gene_type:complete